MNIIKQIYLENTKLTERQLDNLLSHDYWLNSTKCKNLWTYRYNNIITKLKLI